MMTQHHKYGLPREDLQRMAEAARADLIQLRGAHIFLTGCTAFLGKWMVEALLWANAAMKLGMRLTLLTRSTQCVSADMPHWQHHDSLHLVEGNVVSWKPDTVPNISHIIHGANYTNAGQEDWALEHMTTACDGTRRMLELAREQHCAAMLLLSSGAVYGLRQGGGPAPFVEQENGPEDYLREPNVYATCKYFEEMYSAAYGKKHGIRIPIARLFTFMGAYMPLHQRQALSSFLCDAREGRDIVIQGDGKAVRSYMHTSDMVVWLLALLVRGQHGTPYNVGSDEAISIAELAEAVNRVCEKPLRVRILGKPITGNAPVQYSPTITRVWDSLGLKQKVNFADGLARTSKCLCAQPDIVTFYE